MTVNKEYDVAEMLAKQCVRNCLKEYTCPVKDSIPCPFHPEIVFCHNVTSEDWLLWMWGGGIEMTEDKKNKVAEMLSVICREEENSLICPCNRHNHECPFPEKLCEDITQEDWLEWMEATK